MIDIKKSNAVYDFNVSLCLPEYVMHISKMITGNFSEKDERTYALKTLPQAFQDCIFYKRFRDNDMRFGPQLLYFPCRPNSEEYDEYTGKIHQDNYKTDAYLTVRSSLLVADRVKDANPDKLVERLKPTHFSHSTMLDCIFSNANLTSTQKEAQKCVILLD